MKTVLKKIAAGFGIWFVSLVVAIIFEFQKDYPIVLLIFTLGFPFVYIGTLLLMSGNRYIKLGGKILLGFTFIFLAYFSYCQYKGVDFFGNPMKVNNNELIQDEQTGERRRPTRTERLAAEAKAKEASEAIKKEAQAKKDNASNMNWALKQAIKQTAKDPDSLQFRNERLFSNGSCIEANGKNSFGGYVGYKEYCYLTIKGKNVFTVDGVTQ
jgi:hypothetical protein